MSVSPKKQIKIDKPINDNYRDDSEEKEEEDTFG